MINLPCLIRSLFRAELLLLRDNYCQFVKLLAAVRNSVWLAVF